MVDRRRKKKKAVAGLFDDRFITNDEPIKYAHLFFILLRL
jgi:hypothetical protein